MTYHMTSLTEQMIENFVNSLKLCEFIIVRLKNFETDYEMLEDFFDLFGAL